MILVSGLDHIEKPTTERAGSRCGSRVERECKCKSLSQWTLTGPDWGLDAVMTDKINRVGVPGTMEAPSFAVTLC